MDFAIANSIDPGGTALAPDVVVLVEVDEPWPKPVGKHPAMVELVQAAQQRPEQIRLLAAVPAGDAPRRVIAFRPTATGMTRAEGPLCADPVGALHDVLDEPAPAVSQSGQGVATVLVCTQGSHDVCCGTDGVAFADWLDEERPDVEVFRVSHTGGHRFSPTAMTLPDGRMWAYLSPDTANSIIDRTGDARLLAAQCRGWWGAPTGPAQVAERAVFSELGFDADQIERTVTVGEDGALVVEAGTDVFDVGVAIGREVPTIACGAPGGQPVKPGREWIVASGPTRR